MVAQSITSEMWISTKDFYPAPRRKVLIHFNLSGEDKEKKIGISTGIATFEDGQWLLSFSTTYSIPEKCVYYWMYIPEVP